jgi:hypothetical protein
LRLLGVWAEAMLLLLLHLAPVATAVKIKRRQPMVTQIKCILMELLLLQACWMCLHALLLTLHILLLLHVILLLSLPLLCPLLCLLPVSPL